ncbi:MAG: TonB-dependent receptor [Bryobacterales bacterium]|nr:TonB-dependent receptor [Bryobacterales bacterium]
MICLLPRVALCQRATVSGQITDPGGTAVPEAGVTVLNMRTGARTTTSTNERGFYTIPFLQPGDYNISVESKGFQTVTRPAVKLDVDQVARIDFALQLGTITESVSVVGGAPLLDAATSSLSQQIENKTIVTLPLNGRDYAQLIVLGAGAVPDSYSRATNGFNLNGSRTFQNSIQLDGIDNLNRIMGIDTATVSALKPSIDALQEFKVETANYSAEYGQAAGGVISASIKSGTNALHGSAFEFLRNNVLDANDFFANRAGLRRAPLRQNEFGGTVGGRIIRDRVFFFVSYDGTRQNRPSTVATTVPLPGMAQGNFGAGAIYDPLNVVNGVRQQFPSNTIPASRLDPVGAKLAALYPAPNVPGAANNFISNVATTRNADEIDFRSDQHLGNHDSSFVRFSRGTGQSNTGSVFASPGNGGPSSNYYPLRIPVDAYSLVASETHIFSPVFISEFHAGYVHNGSNRLAPESEPLFTQFGFNGIPRRPGLVGLPQITVTGYSQLGDVTITPNQKLSQVFQLNESLSWTHGAHAVKFGGQFVYNRDLNNTANSDRGAFAFSGGFTARSGSGGSALADMLLGQTTSATLATPLVGFFRRQYYGIFIEDIWRVSRNLTLNLGLRYDLATPLRERDNRMGNFDLNPASPTNGTIVPARSGSILSRTFSRLDKNNLAPRLGLAYQATPKTVIRSAVGIFYGALGYQAIGASGALNPPYFLSISFPSTITDPSSALVLAKGFPENTLDPKNARNPGGFSLAAEFPITTVYQWNASVQRELPGQGVLTLAYVGSGTTHLTGDLDANAPPPGPGAINPRRPFPAFGSIVFQGPFAHATYHALQATFQRRFHAGFSLLANYSWSHSIDNVRSYEDGFGGSMAQNPRAFWLEKGPSAFDLRQRFVTSVIYELPVGRPTTLLGKSRFGRALFGGWEVGGIFVAQTGPPVDLTASPNPSNTTTSERPNRVCDGGLPAGMRSVDVWFNVSCFQVPAQYTFGNSAPGSVRAPGLVNLDFMASRTFQLMEGKTLEFRGEFFNVTNSAHFGRPNTTIGTAIAGKIGSTALPNRDVQLGLHFLF